MGDPRPRDDRRKMVAAIAVATTEGREEPMSGGEHFDLLMLVADAEADWWRGRLGEVEAERDRLQKMATATAAGMQEASEEWVKWRARAEQAERLTLTAIDQRDEAQRRIVTLEAAAIEQERGTAAIVNAKERAERDLKAFQDWGWGLAATYLPSTDDDLRVAIISKVHDRATEDAAGYIERRTGLPTTTCRVTLAEELRAGAHRPKDESKDGNTEVRRDDSTWDGTRWVQPDATSSPATETQWASYGREVAALAREGLCGGNAAFVLCADLLDDAPGASPGSTEPNG